MIKQAKPYSTYLLLVFMVLIQACSSNPENTSLKQTQIQEEMIEQDSLVTKTIEIPEELEKKNHFFDFPIPEMDNMLMYSETSGIVEKSPSKELYNPFDSGIFVFHSLIGGEEIDRYDFGSLVTHTYFKKPYGWAAEDKDQTFIALLSGTPFFNINESIGVEHSRTEIENELGSPFFVKDSISFYLGRNGIIGGFTYRSDTVTRFSYNRYQIADSVFNLEETELQIALENLIEDQLKYLTR
ncbi:MAG: hypothetical protein AAF740_07960 [Bacteroidota bacterium]